MPTLTKEEREELGIRAYDLERLDESLNGGSSALGSFCVEGNGKVLIYEKRGERPQLDRFPGFIDYVLESMIMIRDKYNGEGGGIRLVDSLKHLHAELARCGREKELTDVLK